MTSKEVPLSRQNVSKDVLFWVDQDPKDGLIKDFHEDILGATKYFERWLLGSTKDF